MLSSDHVLTELRKIRSLRFEAASEVGSGWQGEGAGVVTVTEPAAGVVLFSEKGTWKPSAAKRSEIGFTNVYRWTAVGELLRLEHLRFGPSAPVFDMTRGAEGVWREVSPHQCSEDSYTASLHQEDGRLLLAWQVNGPQKKESIHYTYW